MQRFQGNISSANVTTWDCSNLNFPDAFKYFPELTWLVSLQDFLTISFFFEVSSLCSLSSKCAFLSSFYLGSLEENQLFSASFSAVPAPLLRTARCSWEILEPRKKRILVVPQKNLSKTCKSIPFLPSLSFSLWLRV